MVPSSKNALPFNFPGGSVHKNLPAMILDNPLEKGLATHSSILALEVSRSEEPGRLQSMGSHELSTERQNHPPRPDVLPILRPSSLSFCCRIVESVCKV